MRLVRVVAVDIVETLLRVLPFPCRTGLRRIGNPGRSSPVLLTGNFRLTVERVQRALKGLDANLLVADSRGVNVWCAATGGLLTSHDVISALRTTGIEQLVDHRQVILPQLAATGVEGRVIREKTGWTVVWGPVRAADIPAFLRGGLHKTRRMRMVSFPWRQRLEMSVAWAFPISLLSLPVLWFSRPFAAALIGLVWGWSLLMFMSFPLYAGRLRARRRSVGLVFFDFGPRGFPLLLWGLLVAGLVVRAILAPRAAWGPVAGWGLASLGVVLILRLDLTGSTPIYKSGLHEDRLLRIAFDPARCTGAGLCVRVCPVDVFEMDGARRRAVPARSERCVQCGACVVQCPPDALAFLTPSGERIPPETIRRFKLNLLGRRRAPAARA